MKQGMVMLVSLCACSGHSGAVLDAAESGDAASDALASSDVMVDAPPIFPPFALPAAGVDVLFVIDNSASTADKQTVLASAFTGFVSALDALPGGRPSLHVGFVSSTVDIGVTGFGPGCPSPAPNDNGVLHAAATVVGCTPPTGLFISDLAQPGGGRVTNYTGTLDQEMACIGQLGETGCGFEAQLEAMKRALDGSRPENAGFVRDGAALFVVILTDEDDASVADSTVFTLPASTVGGNNDFRVQPLFAYDCDTPISATAGGTYTNCKPRTDSYLYSPGHYVDFLTSVKDPSLLQVAVIAGAQQNGSPPSSTIMTGSLTLGGGTQPLALQPSCTVEIAGNSAIARPGIRLADFAMRLAGHGTFSSICVDDDGPTLTALVSAL